MSKETVLIAVIGLTPQLITETLYAMHKQGRPMPKRIVIITTALGRQQARLTLLEEQRLAQFCHDYGLANIPLATDDIKVPSFNGEELDDARSLEAHNAIADFIFDEVRQLTQNDNVRLHASIAGGRKTMTFFLGYAMSLYGREGDELSHVLVSKEFESLADFFYPTPFTKVIKARDESKLDASEAVVTLADIPFVRMRTEMPTRLLSANSPQKYSEVIHSLNLATERCTVTIDITTRRVCVDQLEIRLNPYPLAMYCWLLTRQQQGDPVINPDNSEHWERNGREFLSWLVQIDPEGSPSNIEETLDLAQSDAFKLGEIDANSISMGKGLTIQSFTSTRNKMMRAFRDNLGEALARRITPSKAKCDNGEFIIKQAGSESLPYLVNPEWCDIQFIGDKH